MPPDPASGAEFRGTARFELLRRLGAGGFGVVHEALDRERGERVALKVLQALDPEALYRFKREFRALADVHHDNLVRLHELVSEGEQWFFTMELVDGLDFLSAASDATMATADNRINRINRINGLDRTLQLGPDELSSLAGSGPTSPRRPADPQRLRPLLRQLALGVVALHRRGLQHRDLKPSNVLVTATGRVVILDFGLVLEAQTRRDRSSSPGQIVGTIEYMAPEQAAGLPSTPASDWYSVGVMLFEALTGELPFSGDLICVLRDKLERDAPDPRIRDPGLPGDLAALCLALLARDPDDRPGDDELLALLVDESGPAQPRASHTTMAALPGMSSAEGATPLLGRGDVLATLDEALADARAGQASVVLLRGAAGLGRSAVLARFVAERERDLPRSVVLVGRCSERESVPYKAIDGVIDALARELHGRDEAAVDSLLPPHVHTLARLFPVLRRVPAIARSRSGSGDDRLAPHELRQQAFEALRGLLARLAASGPPVLVIDDLHWGDLDSAALLRELLAAPDPPPLLLIASHRSEASDDACVRALRDGLRDHPLRMHRSVELTALAPADATALAHARLAGSPRQGEAAAIASEAGGNPLLIVELCHFVAGATDLDALARAASFDALLRRRIAGLDLESRALLEVVAVAAEPIDPRVVGEVARHPGDWHPILAALRREHLLRSHRVAGQTHIEAFHERVRVAVLVDVDPARVRAIHGALADALERCDTPDIERLRVHLQAAGETARAAAYTLQAAARASAALAFERAAALYRDALAHATADERPRLEVLLGDTLANDGRGVEAAEAYLRAAEALHGDEALDLLRRAGFERLRSGQIDEGLAVLEKVLASVDMGLSASRGLALLALLGHRVALALRGLRFRERRESEIPPALLRRADVAWSIGASGLGMVDDIAAGEFQSLALRLALRAGDPMRICRALAGEVAFSAVGGTRSVRRTARLLHTARTLAERLDQPHARGTVAMTAGIAAYLGGRFREAADACAAAEPILRACSGSAWELINANLFGLQAQVYLGELAAIAARVPGLTREAERRGNLYLVASLRAGPTHLHWLARDAVDEAAAGIDEAERRWSTRGVQVQHYWQIHARCDLDLYRGDAAAALARIDRRWPDLGTLLRIQLVRIEALHLRARCLLAAGAPAARVLADARAIESEKAPWGDALAQLVRAGLAARSGDRSGARVHLAEAAAGCDPAGMALHAAAARRRRGELTSGADGQRWREPADTWLKGQGVADIPRLLAVLAPGFPR